MTDDEVTILARLSLLSMPPALLPRPYSQAEIEQIAKDAHGLAHRHAANIVALEAEVARLRDAASAVIDEYEGYMHGPAIQRMAELRTALEAKP